MENHLIHMPLGHTCSRLAATVTNGPCLPTDFSPILSPTSVCSDEHRHFYYFLSIKFCLKCYLAIPDVSMAMTCNGRLMRGCFKTPSRKLVLPHFHLQPNCSTSAAKLKLQPNGDVCFEIDMSACPGVSTEVGVAIHYISKYLLLFIYLFSSPHCSTISRYLLN